MKPDNVIRLMAGSFVLISVALTFFVSPWGLLLGLFVGTMLIVSATTGFCPPTLLFARFGWIDSNGNVSPFAKQPVETPVPSITPQEAADRTEANQALLIDVREPDEWRNGVAADARLLPLSDFRGGQFLWKPFLAEAGERELCLYCGSGARASIVARQLIAQGHRVSCVGGFSDWCATQQKVRSALA